MERYVKHTKAKTSIRVRKPVLAIWFWKRDRDMQLPIEETLISEDLEKMLKHENQKYKDKVVILYGPKNR